MEHQASPVDSPSVTSDTPVEQLGNFALGPYAPTDFEEMPQLDSIASSIETLTNAEVVPDIASRINEMIGRWDDGERSVEPYSEMRSILEGVRQLPPGEQRVKSMNSIVRTLGRPATLATFLDMLRGAAKRSDSKDLEIYRNKLQVVRLHSIYGWCGNTLMVESFDEPTEGTYKHPAPGLGEKLGNSTAAWNLTVHIWQPNSSARGFIVDEASGAGIIKEPPHSHPFNFVSTVVTGSMHQSIFSQSDGSSTNGVGGYYDRTPLEHVDGVWPPHDFRRTSRIETVERSVRLNPGDSYFLPCDWIHDVEIDRNLATTRPTITLFLSSEYAVMPHVYMAQSMADFHRLNPSVKSTAKSIPEEAWHRKLEAISAYLRGESSTLDLNQIVKHSGEYAFFHVGSSVG